MYSTYTKAGSAENRCLQQARVEIGNNLSKLGSIKRSMARELKDFLFVYPKYVVSTSDRQVDYTLDDLKKLPREQLEADIKQRLERDYVWTPRVPGGRNVLTDYYDVFAAGNYGKTKAVAAYLACQDKISQLGDAALQKAERYGWKFSLAKATLAQSKELLGIKPIGADSPLKAADDLIKALKITPDEWKGYMAVAEHYTDTRENWLVLRGWLAGKQALQGKSDVFSLPVAEVIEAGAVSRASALADELQKKAGEMAWLDQQKGRDKLFWTVKQLFAEHPKVCFPKLVESTGYDVHFTMGSTLGESYAAAFEGRHNNEKPRHSGGDFRGVTMPGYKKIFNLTGGLSEGKNGEPEFNQWRINTVTIEENFHAADLATRIKVDGDIYRPSQLIDRNKIHKWKQRFEQEAAPHLESMVDALGMNSAQRQRFEHNLNQFLLPDGEGIFNEKQLEQASLSDKLKAVAEVIINLREGYDGTYFWSRSMESVVRFHRAMHTVFKDLDNTYDATAVLQQMLPDFHRIYSKVLLPSMVLAEEKAGAISFFDKAKVFIKDIKFKAQLFMNGGVKGVMGEYFNPYADAADKNLSSATQESPTRLLEIEQIQDSPAPEAQTAIQQKKPAKGGKPAVATTAEGRLAEVTTAEPTVSVA